MNYKDLNLTEKELDELQKQLNERKDKKRYEENIKKIEDNKKYIGKCYKEDNHKKYIRVLSSKSTNQYHFECMCFDFPISFKEDYLYMRKVFTPDCAFSKIDFQGIYVEDYPLLCNSFWSNKKVVDTLIEITEEEYFEKMNEYVQKLQTLIKEDYFNTSKDNKSIFQK